MAEVPRCDELLHAFLAIAVLRQEDPAISRFIFVILLACGGISGQTFEVASFRRLSLYTPRGGLVKNITATSISLRNASLGNCIEFAYGYRNFEVVGPEWRDYPTDARYQIEAKAAAPVSEPTLKMLRTLLAERLGLVFHRELRELPVYALVLDRRAPGLHKSESEGDPSAKPGGPYVMKFERMPMARFAAILDPPFASRHVVDETGLAGGFDFTLDFSREILDSDTNQPMLNPRGALDMESAVMQAMPKQLGLRLVPKKALTEIMVIDRVEKDPGEN